MTYWEGKLRAEYESYLLGEYRCRWVSHAQRPQSISQPHYYETPFHSRQRVLFDPLWVRDPIEGELPKEVPKKMALAGKQLRLYFGPELVKR